MSGAEHVESTELERLPTWWIFALFLYAGLAVVLSLPHLDSLVWVAVVVAIALATALVSAFGISAKRPTDISIAERRIAILHSPGAPATGVALFFVAIAVSSSIEWLLRVAFDVDVSWPRVIAQLFFLVVIPAMGGGDYDSVWYPQLVDRPNGVPTGFAAYDVGKTGLQFTLLALVLLLACALTLIFEAWWISIPALVIVMVSALSFTPQRAEQGGAGTIERARRALEALGFEMLRRDESNLSEGEQALVNPVIQSVDLRARSADAELVLAFYDEAEQVVTWEEANRLLAAARSLSWSGASGSSTPSAVHPLLVLVDAQADESLTRFAQAERCSVVRVSDVDAECTVIDNFGAADLEQFAHLLRGQTNERMPDGSEAGD